MLNGTLPKPETARDCLELLHPEGAREASAHTATNLTVALQLADAGLPIFPAIVVFNPRTGRYDKRPRISDWQTEATTDADRLRDWWQNFPTALPGIELGRARVMGIDADRHGGPDGVSAFNELVNVHGLLPSHPKTLTPGDGEHHLFGQPAGVLLGNRRGNLPAGIDVRGAGGWLVAPGAVRSDERRWEPAPGAPSLADAYRTGTIPPLPDWLARFISAHPPRPEPGAAFTDSTSCSRRTASSVRREETYARAALSRCVEELRRAPGGTRNNSLNHAAFDMGRMVARGWIERADVEGGLWQACVSNALVRDDGVAAVRATLASGLTAGLQNPHPALEDRGSSPIAQALERTRSTDHNGPAGQTSTIAVARCLADVPPEPMNWLWPQRVARGKLNIIAGQPGGGKSQCTLAMAANVSTGSAWPDGTTCPLGTVIIISCEDDVSDTIVPRLIAAGADLNRVHVLDWVQRPSPDGPPSQSLFNLTRDVPALEGLIRRLGDVVLIIIDPISAYVGGIDSHKASDVRGALAPLQALAAKSQAAIVVVAHLNKGNADGAAMARVGGSGAFVAACRSAWLVETDPQDTNRKRRILTPLKNNIGDDTTGFAFSIQPVDLPGGIKTSHVVFERDAVVVSASELLRGQQQNEEERGALQDAIEFLRQSLADGPMATKEVEKAAKDAGIATRTIERARAKLRVSTKKVAEGWVLALPDTEDRQLRQDRQAKMDGGHGEDAQELNPAKNCTSENVGGLGGVGGDEEQSPGGMP